ncbi:MAG TPA: VOC family protein [Sphingomicrobium sp.]|nr:VOC family protein [Sphingomicrobium sp.]
MFSHVMVGTNDMERSRRFYDALFGKEAHVDDKGRLRYAKDGAVFMVSNPIDGAPATPANGGTIGFNFDSPEGIDVWHQSGIEAGGTSVEDPPAWRDRPTGKLYLAYLRDPDGNKLCGLHRPQQ